MTTSVLMTGATGKQGGALLMLSLLSAADIGNILIFALTRNAKSSGAKKLAAKAPDRIKLIEGGLNDCKVIFKAISTPIKGVFCVSVPVLGPRAESETEEVRGKALIYEALEHGVEHFVYTSVDRHGLFGNPRDAYATLCLQSSY